MGGGDDWGSVIMARYTSAYCSFVVRMDEVTVLRKSAARLERIAPVANSKQIDALCRGGVVLLSSHLEAFIKELGELLLRRLFDKGVNRSTLDQRFFYHVSKDRVDNIQNATDPELVAKTIFEFLAADQDLWVRSGALPRYVDSERFNGGFSSPKFKKIKSYFNRFGFQTYHGDLQRNLTRNFVPYTNMVNHLVDIRNLIAHGDPGATKTPAEVKDMVDIVIQFCRATDKVFASWCKSKYCAIR